MKKENIDNENKMNEFDGHTNDYEIEVEDNANIETVKEEIFKIEVRLQEIDAIIERYEDALLERDEEIITSEELGNLKSEYKELRKKKKELGKSKKASKWETIPVWLAIYSIFQIILSLFFLLMKVSLEFAGWVLEIVLSFSDPGIWLFYVSYFFIPFILLLASLIILLKLKDKFVKKFFAIVYIIHGIEVLVTVILMIISATSVA